MRTLADSKGLLALIAEIKELPHADVATYGHACHVGGNADQQLYHVTHLFEECGCQDTARDTKLSYGDSFMRKRSHQTPIFRHPPGGRAEEVGKARPKQ